MACCVIVSVPRSNLGTRRIPIDHTRTTSRIPSALITLQLSLFSSDSTTHQHHARPYSHRPLSPCRPHREFACGRETDARSCSAASTRPSPAASRPSPLSSPRLGARRSTRSARTPVRSVRNYSSRPLDPISLPRQLHPPAPVATHVRNATDNQA